MSIKTRIADPGTSLEANVVEAGGHRSLVTKVSDGDIRSANDVRTAWHPMPDEASSGEFSTLKVDPDNNLMTRGTVLTDEGSFRFLFTGTLETTLTGTVTFVSGSRTVTGIDTLFTEELLAEDYIKYTVDDTHAYAQIEEVVSDTELLLYEAYTGTSVSASGETCRFHYHYSGTGASVAHNTDVIEITSGTANLGEAHIERSIDYLPMSMNFIAALTQRIANQETIIELYGDADSYARIVFDGTSNNTITFASGNGSLEQTTSVVLTDGLTTDQEINYEILVVNRSCQLLVNNKIVATHLDHIPLPYETLMFNAQMTNSAAVTETKLKIHTIFGSNENIVQISNDFSPLKVEVVDTVGTEIITSGEGFAKGYVSLSTTSQSQVRKTAYTLQSTNMQISLASASASDTSAGTGARTVEIIYYDQNLVGPFSETLTLNGTTGVNSVATNICHIERMRIRTAGSGGVAAGIISIYTAINKGGSIFGSIAAGDTSTQWCHHFVGAGVVCSISSILIGNSGDAAGKASRFVLKNKEILTANSVDDEVSEIIRVPGGVSALYRGYDTPIKIQGPSRLLMYVTPESANAYDEFASFSFTED